MCPLIYLVLVHSSMSKKRLLLKSLKRNWSHSKVLSTFYCIRDNGQDFWSISDELEPNDGSWFDSSLPRREDGRDSTQRSYDLSSLFLYPSCLLCFAFSKSTIAISIDRTNRHYRPSVRAQAQLCADSTFQNSFIDLWYFHRCIYVIFEKMTALLCFNENETISTPPGQQMYRRSKNLYRFLVFSSFLLSVQGFASWLKCYVDLDEEEIIMNCL